MEAENVDLLPISPNDNGTLIIEQLALPNALAASLSKLTSAEHP
jgi:hypothetical protein